MQQETSSYLLDTAKRHIGGEISEGGDDMFNLMWILIKFYFILAFWPLFAVWFIYRRPVLYRAGCPWCLGCNRTAWFVYRQAPEMGAEGVMSYG